MIPLLAERCHDLAALKFPLYAAPELQGVRCLVTAEGAQGWNQKPIPNDFIRAWIEHLCPVGFDGELVVTDEAGTALDVEEGRRLVNSNGSQPFFVFHVFDHVRGWKLTGPSYTWSSFAVRLIHLDEAMKKIHDPQVATVPTRYCSCMDDLLAFEDHCLGQGHPGIFTRHQWGTYKEGRSEGGQHLLVRPIRDGADEAVIKGVYEHKTAKGSLGGLLCQSRGIQFNLDHGFGEDLRKTLWEEWGDALVGQRVGFSHQPLKGKPSTQPRFPLFNGFLD